MPPLHPVGTNNAMPRCSLCWQTQVQATVVYPSASCPAAPAHKHAAELVRICRLCQQCGHRGRHAPRCAVTAVSALQLLQDNRSTASGEHWAMHPACDTGSLHTGQGARSRPVLAPTCLTRSTVRWASELPWRPELLPCKPAAATTTELFRPCSWLLIAAHE